jgi:zinc protease
MEGKPMNTDCTKHSAGVSARFRIAVALFVVAVIAPVSADARAVPLGGGAIADQIPGGPALLLVPQHSVPMFSLTVIVPAGSALETPETNGAAHYLEHLLFNGTTTRTRERIYADGDLLGAYNNASTQREKTVFQLMLPSENWREGLRLQADMLLHSTLPPDMFEKEKGIILEELAKDRSDPGYDARLFAERVLYGEDARSLPVLGTEESIANMDPAALAAFYRDRYHPAGMTILAMGDFPVSELRDELTALYGGRDGTPDPLPPRPDFPAGAELHRMEAAGLGSVELHLRIPLPGVSGIEDHAAASLLATVLSEGETDGITRAVTAATGAAPHSAGASFDPGDPWSVLRISADLPADVGVDAARAAISAVGAHLAKLASTGVASADLETARLAFAVEEISYGEKMHYYGLMRADLLAVGGPTAPNALLDAVGQATRGDLARVLAGIVADGRVTASAAGPGMGDGTEAIGAFTAGKGADWLPDAAEATTPRIDLSPRPMVESPVFRRAALPGGATLIVHATPDSRTFAAHALYRNRSARERATGVPSGTTDILHRMMALGTETMTRDELRGRLAELGATLKTTDSDWIPYDDYSFTPEFSYIRLTTIDSFGADAMALLGEIVRSPRFDQETLRAAMSTAVARAAKDAGSPRSLAWTLFHDTLGEGHPLADRVHGDLAAGSVTLDAARAHHATYFHPSNLILSVSTSLPPEEVIRAATDAFATRAPAPTAPGGASFRPAPAAGRTEAVLETGREQSRILVGSTLSVDPADEPALRMAVAVLSERLADRLREKEGLAYSIGASLRLDEPGACVRLIAGTRPDNLPRMEEGMLEIARELAETPPTAEELDGARNRGEGRRRMRRLSRIGMAYSLGMAEFRGEDPAALDEDLPALRAVTPEDVARAAATYLTLEDYTCAIAR